MLDDLSAEGVAAQVRHALQCSGLSQTARTQGEALLSRLVSGVTIMVLGPTGIGKSQLCDTIFDFSDQEVSNTETRIFSSGTAADLPIESFGRVRRVSVTSMAFGQASLIDVDMSIDHDARTKIALNQADIVLWCTQGFEPVEALLWAQANDTLKDHSFLVLTKADQLANHKELGARIHALQAVVDEEFHSLYPTTTAHLQQVLRAGQTVTDAQKSAGGLKALVDAVASLVASGRRADLDSAMLFLERYGTPCDAVENPNEQTAEAGPDKRLPFKKARDAIIERSLDLAELGFDDADNDMAEILELCGTISEELTEALQAHVTDAPNVTIWCNAFEEASDKIMLMAMENDTRSAADAVTILLQLRRDLEYLSVH